MADAVVACRDVVQIYASERGTVQALRGVDVDAHAGSVTAVVGPSGSGKSSLLRLLAAIDVPAAGEVTLTGRSLGELSGRRRRRLRRRAVGFVSQRPADNLEPGVPLRRQLRAAARFRQAELAAADELLEELGLSTRAGHRPGELSGGEQQRAALARALIGGPALLVADEPTAELDRTATVDVCASLRRLAADRGLAVVVATHDAAVLAAADRVLHLRDGAVQSATLAGEQRAVVDGAGRVQLPPEVVAWFPNQRVRLEVDPETRTVRIWPS